MRFLPLVVIGATLLIAPSLAQTASQRTSGIYKTATYYQNRRLDSEGDCRSKSHKIEFYDVWHKPYVDLGHETENQRLFKGSMFGFRTCEGYEYRFFRFRVSDS